MRARQGALDLNAYLLTNLAAQNIPTNSEDMDLLYLNLKRLSRSANQALAIQRSIDKNELEINAVVIADHPNSKPYDYDLSSIAYLLELELANSK